MTIRPLQDRVLLKREEVKKTTASGLYIPDTATEKPMWHEVVSTGPGKHAENGTFMKVSVEKGQRVLLGKYAGTEIKIDEEDYLVVREEDILCVDS